jgi:hypothetical protein
MQNISYGWRSTLQLKPAAVLGFVHTAKVCKPDVMFSIKLVAFIGKKIVDMNLPRIHELPANWSTAILFPAGAHIFLSSPRLSRLSVSLSPKHYVPDTLPPGVRRLKRDADNPAL